MQSNDMSIPASAREPRLRWIVLLTLALIAALLWGRWHMLDQAPDGFYIDEAAIAAQVLCLAEAGTSADGEPWPLFANVLGGGHASPTLMYPAALWSQVVGESIAQLRALSVLHGVFALLLIATVAWRAGGHFGVALTASVVGLSSPWWFTATRLFWDPVYGASWWMVALALYFAGRDARLSGIGITAAWVCAGLAAAAAAYAYAPIRVQMALSVLLILAVDRPWRRIGWGLLLPVSVTGLILLPLLAQYVFDAGFTGRGSMLAIWNDHWLQSNGLTVWDVPRVAAKHLAAHLDPAYLFLEGDSNRRHSIGFGGLVGPVEVAVIGLVSVLAPGFLRSRDSLLLIGLFVAGLLAAALTWEGVPHALRSLGAVGPLLLWYGLGLAAIQRAAPQAIAHIVTILLVVALVSGGRFASAYFGEFARESTVWFRGDTDPSDWSAEFDLARRYFRMAQHGESCRSPE
jgi:hypothetical protein